MKINSVYVINDIFIASCTEVFNDFKNEYLNRFHAEAYFFVPEENKNMKQQVLEAVNVAISKKFDLVILDIYFGQMGDPESRLGINIALNPLIKNNIPVILWSGIEDSEIALNNLLDAHKLGNIRYLPNKDIERLPELIEDIIFSFPENRVTETFGFKVRLQEEIDQRNILASTFDQVCRKHGSQLIEVPLAAPVSNFIGAKNRPLPEKHSQKLFTSITPDGLPMAIRYEGTMLVAKQISTDLRKEKDFRDKTYHYFQEMLRVEYSSELDTKHFRSFYQAGIESFTIDSAYRFERIAEILDVTIQFLKKCGFVPTIRLSHLDILQIPLSVVPFAESFLKRRIIGLMEKGSIDDVKEGLQVCRLPKKEYELLLELAYYREVSLADGVKLMKKHSDYYRNLVDELETICTMLVKKGIDDNCKFDPGINRSLGFYSGLTFQGDVPGMKECLGGGEFTGLVESFGTRGPVYSVGMAAGVERLMERTG